MGCERDCESCGCDFNQEAEWQYREKMEQLEHERSLEQLLFWSAVAFSALTLFFGFLCFLTGIGILPESPVLGFSGFIFIFAVWCFLITR